VGEPHADVRAVRRAVQFLPATDGVDDFASSCRGAGRRSMDGRAVVERIGERMSKTALSIIADHLSDDDDPQLWEVAITTLLTDAGQAAAAEKRVEVFSEIGCCHHWISPHRPIRWEANGGFAWPFGYNRTVTGFSYRALPEFTWSECLSWTGEDWKPGRTGRRCLIFRIAVPARTARHSQAAIHTIWTPHAPNGRQKLVQLYGFRKQAAVWSLVAHQALRESL
jgi:hypothetical protein